MKKTAIAVFMLLTGILMNAETSYSNMFWNQALILRGSDTDQNWLSVPHHSSLNLNNNFTIEAWILPLSYPGSYQQKIVKKHTVSGGYEILINNNNLIEVKTNGIIRLISTGSLSLNDWTHIAVTHNFMTNQFSIYINGILNNTSVITGARPLINGDSLIIGDNFISIHKGVYIDEFRIWGIEKNSFEIQEMMRTSLGIMGTGIYGGLSLSLTFQDKNSAGNDFVLKDWSFYDHECFLRNGTIEETELDLNDRPQVTINQNECIELNGYGYLSGESDPKLNPVQAVTLEAWIYRKDAGDGFIIHKGSIFSEGDYSLRVNSGGYAQCYLNGVSFPQSNSKITIGEWAHIGFVFNSSNGNYRYYINGVNDKEGTNNIGVIANSGDSLVIGLDFNGFIDEVKISRYAKTKAMINEFLYKPMDHGNEPNQLQSNVVYNFDGYDTDNTDNGPRLNFHGQARFSHSGSISGKPVSPLVRDDQNKFSNSFYITTANARIPAVSTTGDTWDTLDIVYDSVINDLNVFVALNHTDETELRIELISPEGTMMILFDNTSLIPNSGNIITIFDDQADSSQNQLRYVSFAPSVKGLNLLNSGFAGENSAGKWKIKISDETGSGTGKLYAWGLHFNNTITKTYYLGLTAAIEGRATSCPLSVDGPCLLGSDTLICTIINRETMLDIGRYPVASEGTGSQEDLFRISNVNLDNEYYLKIEHRNSIETWSVLPVEFDFQNGTADYDFTDDASKAFGSNQISIQSGSETKYAFYSGDVNQDGIIDASDNSSIDNDVTSFITGYAITDLNGDEFVDASDAVLADNNSARFISKITP